MLFKTSGLIMALTLWGGALAAQEAVTMAECDKLNPNKGADLRKAMGCVELYKSKLEDIEIRLTALEAVRTPAIGDHEKTRAVVAYVADKGQASCPKGWELFEEAKDKFVLGAGGAMADVTDTGGEAKVTLKPENLPRHNHRSDAGFEGYWASVSGDSPDHGFQGNGKKITALKPRFVGEDKPHNNMPPYIALYYCIKSS